MHRLWDHNVGYESQSQAWKLTISKWRVARMDADTSFIKKKYEWNPMACEEWMENNRDMEGESLKGDGHQHGR